LLARVGPRKEVIVKTGLATSGFLVLALGLGLSACGDTADGMGDGGLGGSSGSGGTAGSLGGTSGAGGGGAGGSGTADGGGSDLSGGGKTYKYIAIVDNNTMPMCDTTGPGADIDSVDLRHAGSTSAAGVGLKDSAKYATQTGATACATCGSAAAACPYSGMTAAARAEGIQDGMSYTNMMDTGYIALNSGVVWLQIGSANGNGPAQDIVSGDTITVYEIDKYYVETGRAPGCTGCLPEKYSVFAYVDMASEATKVQLVPTKYKTENVATCTATPSGNLGCGTTDFLVP
jgi:hypothetical protein